ncbi:expressed unknown protein [Seminavis robusta]|uniref:Uncharacterized protein n=1 Tax=Seminavis robusta TaxID=568900 RepID=A0A9N8ED10_9STRA|nr:expressed unknown protein [Seminavis robusta]|eukprot:Sro943_g222860.1 n/a (215) ;mRNA; r:40047-40939
MAHSTLKSCLKQQGVSSRPKRNLQWTQELVASWVYPSRGDDILWMDPEEFFDLKKASRLFAKQWRLNGFTVLLKDTYEHPRSDAQRVLNAFVQLEGNDCGRGMERRGSKQHGEERTYLKKRALQAVLLHQRRLLVRGADMDELWEELGDVSNDYTRTAKIFARRIAKADENAVHFPDPESGYSVLEELRAHNQNGRRPMMAPTRRGSEKGVNIA